MIEIISQETREVKQVFDLVDRNQEIKKAIGWVYSNAQLITSKGYTNGKITLMVRQLHTARPGFLSQGACT